MLGMGHAQYDGQVNNRDNTTRLNLHMHLLNESRIREYVVNRFEKKDRQDSEL